MKKILCFGDSNTWGYNPDNKERFPEGIRWTSLLADKYENRALICEEGLCGRTTIYEDRTREGLKGINSIDEIFARNQDVDQVIIMLGTNDCKTFNNSSAKDIARGIEQCIEKIGQYVDVRNILLISPIHLGNRVWEPQYDPEFSPHSVTVSKGLKEEYKMVALKNGTQFLAASDYVLPSAKDQEHLDREAHRILAEVIYNKLNRKNSIGICA